MGRNVKIKIMKEVPGERVAGRPVDAPPVLFRECWAEPLSLKSAELYNSLQAEMSHIIVLKVRYCKAMEALWNFKGYHIIFNENKYRIYDIDFAKNDRQYLEIRCEAVK
jgi:SPP1 family predicted phage head-tail adaptor